MNVIIQNCRSVEITLSDPDSADNGLLMTVYRDDGLDAVQIGLFGLPQSETDTLQAVLGLARFVKEPAAAEVEGE
jgi:hypothetical protein